MTEREKIIEIIESNKLCVLDMDCNDCPYKDKLNKTYSCGSYKLADTLIIETDIKEPPEGYVAQFNCSVDDKEIDITEYVHEENFSTEE